MFLAYFGLYDKFAIVIGEINFGHKRWGIYVSLYLASLLLTSLHGWCILTCLMYFNLINKGTCHVKVLDKQHILVMLLEKNHSTFIAIFGIFLGTGNLIHCGAV